MLYSPSFFNSNNTVYELLRLQNDLQTLFGGPSALTSIRAAAFPPLNIASTAEEIHVYAFAPGLDPSKLEVSVDRGVLTIAGERISELPKESRNISVHAAERFAGTFKRVMALPDDADPGNVEATYRDGVIRIKLARQQKMAPQRIEIK